MNLSDNIKRIRKENNLSQEQLADKLGVSRQSVSKWESGLAYPEMDKVLQICKMFDLNIDELMNQNIKVVNESKQSKNNVNKFIDDFLDYITKTIDMFSSMKLKEQLKCLIEQFVLGCIIIVVLLVLGLIVKNIVGSLLSFLPSNIYYSLYNILINGVYLLFCLVFGISLLLYIFKIRYLDYYIIVKEQKEETLVVSDEEEVKDSKDKKSKRKFFSKPEKEKIIIREPKHSGYKFISSLVKLFLLILKSFVVLIAFGFCLSLIMFVIGLILSLLFIKTGALFIGLFIILLAFILINLVILIILYTFVVDKKRDSKKLSLSFLISLIMIGVGTGLFLIGIKDFKIIDSVDNSRYSTVEEILKMKDNMYFIMVPDENYIESNSNDVKVVFTYSNHMQHDIYENDNGHVEIWYGEDYSNIFEIMNTYIEDINNKRIVDYYHFEVKIYTSKENIKKLKDNRENYYKESEQSYINELRDEIDSLKDKNYEYYLENENLKEKIDILENQLNNNSCE